MTETVTEFLKTSQDARNQVLTGFEDEMLEGSLYKARKKHAVAGIGFCVIFQV